MNTALLDLPPEPKLLSDGNGAKPPIEIPVVYAAGEPDKFSNIAAKLGDVAHKGNLIINSPKN